MIWLGWGLVIALVFGIVNYPKTKTLYDYEIEEEEEFLNFIDRYKRSDCDSFNVSEFPIMYHINQGFFMTSGLTKSLKETLIGNTIGSLPRERNNIK